MEMTPALVAGLGNPGSEYENTRHNFGFDVLDRLASLNSVTFSREKKFNADLARIEVQGRKVVLIKPLSYMNLSGPVVRKVCDFFKVAPSEALVVLDDANMPLGRLRFRTSGSDGGHHGLESVSRSLGTTGHPRQRLGIGRGDNLRQIAGFVLQKFHASEMDLKERVEKAAVKQIICWLTDGPESAIQRFNGSVLLDPENTRRK
jgi:PTH1 family peptidyl-tRNA hydrolase